MNLSVLVPYRPDDGWRDRAWAWNRARWEALGVELIVESPGRGANAADFNHPFAINRAAEKATHDVFFVADADTAFCTDWVIEAVDCVRRGAPWVLPRFYDRLTKEATEALLAVDPLDHLPPYEVDHRGDSVSWSGLGVIPREGFETVGGYDEHWVHWGGDDVAFACATTTLWGQAVRLEGSAIHCWHPRTSLDAQPGDQYDRMHAYLAAADNVEAMRALIAT